MGTLIVVKVIILKLVASAIGKDTPLTPTVIAYFLFSFNVCSRKIPLTWECIFCLSEELRSSWLVCGLRCDYYSLHIVLSFLIEHREISYVLLLLWHWYFFMYKV